MLKLNTHFIKKALVPSTIIGIGAYWLHQKQKRKLSAIALSGLLASSVVTTVAHAQMSEQLIMTYAQNMQNAANSQNISQIARLLSDDVVVSLTRQGKGTTTLDKSGYLDLLQKSWTQTRNYHYSIAIDNILITGDSAKAQVNTKETWQKDGKTIVLTTTSRATLGITNNNVVLLRSVAQVAVE